MRLNEGTRLKLVMWKNPHLTLAVGQDKVTSLVVSIEQGGPWVVTEFDHGGRNMRPLAGRVMVVLDETA